MPPPSFQTNEQSVLKLAQQRKLLRARDLQKYGLPTISLTRLASAGKLERIARGLYSLPDNTISEHHSLAQAAILVPRGVICLVSALRVHEIGTEAPFEVWIAIPQHMVSPRIMQLALRIVRVSGQSLTEGADSGERDR